MSVSAPLAAIRAQHPLLHCISNIVSANDCANLALAIGASPIMAQAPQEMADIAAMEIQPKNMTDEEKALCKKAISEYKEIRPVVQFGDLYRLVSPYDNQGLSSIMYVSEAKDKAVFYWWKIANFYNVHLPLVKMAGLDANKLYKVRELDVIDNKPLDCEGKSYSGKYLMEHGLEMPYTNEVDWGKKTDWSSRVLYLEAQ